MTHNRLDRPVLLLRPLLKETLAEEPGLERGIQNHIGLKLRAMYDELKDQPVPERFLELLGSLDRNAVRGKKLDG
jgi:hypothetical protein